MDLTKTIQDLCAERDDLDRAIASLSELHACSVGKSRGAESE